MAKELFTEKIKPALEDFIEDMFDHEEESEKKPTEKPKPNFSGTWVHVRSDQYQDFLKETGTLLERVLICVFKLDI